MSPATASAVIHLGQTDGVLIDSTFISLSSQISGQLQTIIFTFVFITVFQHTHRYGLGGVSLL